MDFRPTEAEEVTRRAVREFAAREIAPHVMEWDEAQAFPDALLAQLAELGLLGIQFPTRYGGAGMSAVEYCICIEELARVRSGHRPHRGRAQRAGRARMSRCSAPRRRRSVGWRRWRAGSFWGRGRLPSRMPAATRAVCGRGPAAKAMAGSSTARRRSRPHAGLAGLTVVMAVTDPAARRHGISAFVVERGAPGLSAGRKENKLGMRSSTTADTRLDGCRVAADHLLGREGHGFVDAMAVLDAGRIGIAALAVGLAQGAFDAARRHAAARTQFGRPLASFQAIQWKLADMATGIDAARLLTYRAAYLKDQGRPTTRESSMAKLYASEVAVRAAGECVQVHGGYGFVKDYPAEKLYRDVKLLTIGEGTSEIQRLVIARQYLS